jgi:uncharacterized protein YndB with AHSA1/START domain
MATIRHHTRIDRAPDEVWKVVSDAGSISTWFPLIEQSRAEDGGVPLPASCHHGFSAGGMAERLSRVPAADANDRE